MALLSFAGWCCSGQTHAMSLGGTLASVQEMPLTLDRMSPLLTARSAWETVNLGLGNKLVPGASPATEEGNQPQTGGSGLQPAPNPVYS